MTQMSESLSLVTSETTLPDTSSRRAIVKLHGDITKNSDEHYEFDGDKNLKYIIAKEDYDTYMTKHQGFSYLMRLAMLQGRFCLIGFSGSDPNYMLWLQWMKDVLDKAHEQDENDRTKKPSDSSQTRVFLISVDRYNPDVATKLFYKNHHVGVIDLTDAQVQAEINKTIGDDILHDNTAPKSRSALLEALFAYLQSFESADDRFQTRSIYKDRSIYDKLWSDAYDALQNHQNLQSIIQKIEKRYDSSLYPTRYLYQDSIVTSILHNNTLSDNAAYRKLVALAVRDLGTLPSYYPIKQEDGMEGEEVWQKQMLRENILRSTYVTGSIPSECSPLDRIMIYAFRFDFQNMYEELLKWKPKKEDQPKRWLLLSLFQDREKYLEDLDAYIESQRNLPHKMNACAIRNLQSRDFIQKYDVYTYIREGGEPISDRIHEASKNVEIIKKDMSAYGTSYTTISFSSGNSAYEKSTRLINMLYDNAYLPMYYEKWNVDDKGWYDVFTYIYEPFIYPAIFYSAFLRDNKMLRKMGQEIAYSQFLYPELGRLLAKMLEALDNEFLPGGMRQGLLVMSRELYVAVKPQYWEDLFMRNVFIPLIARWNNKVSLTDYDVQNIGTALNYIANPEIVTKVFLFMLDRMDSNPTVAMHILRDGCRLESLKLDDPEVRKSIRHIVNVGHLEQYALLYRLLAKYNKLTDEQRTIIGEKIEKEDLSYAQDSAIEIYHLAALATTRTQQHYIRDLVMNYDVWDCGLAGRYFSEPLILNIANFPGDWTWREEEIEYNVTCIQDNIYEILHARAVREDIIRNSYISWIMEAIKFADKFGYWNTHKGDLLTKRIHDVMRRFDIDDSIEMLLLSNDEKTIIFGFRLLRMQLDSLSDINNINRYESEMSTIITRALLHDAHLFQNVVIMLCYLVEKFPVQMIKLYKDKLLRLLRDAIDVDYRELNLNLITVYNRMRDVAHVLQQHAVKDEVVDEWMTNDLLTRFNSQFLKK